MTELEFDSDTPGFLANPYPLYHRLRAADPVHWSHRLDAWVLTRYADVAEVLRSPRFSRAQRAERYLRALTPTVRRDLAPLERWLTSRVSMNDPPQHTRLRRLLNPLFARTLLEAVRPRLERIAEDLLDQVEPAGGMEVMRDFAVPLPLTFVMEMMAIPTEDRDRVRRWAERQVAFLSGGSGGGAERALLAWGAQEAGSDFDAYLRDLIARRRGGPEANFLGALLDSYSRDDGLSERELLVACQNMISSGYETTAALIGNGLVALLHHPQELARLRSRPSLIDAAVEELLRYDAPNQFAERIALEDIAVGDRRIAAGQVCHLVLGAANRDPEVFAEPDRLDVTRSDPKHVAFGAGPHQCLGAPLARLTAATALGALLRRFSGLRIEMGAITYTLDRGVRAPVTLPVSFVPAH